MSYSAFSSAQSLTFLFTALATARPTAWTMHLYDGDPEAAGVEFTDSAYASQAVAFTLADADANSRSEVTNDAAITFPALADAAATARFIIIKDQAANIVARVELTPERALGIGEIFSIPTGGFEIKGE